MSTISRPAQRVRRASAVLAAAALVGTSVTFGATAAMAAPDAITVTSLGLGGNAVAGTCEATPGAGDCTLRGALEIANASTNADGVEIVFDAALAGTGEIAFTAADDAARMHTAHIGATGGNHSGTMGDLGARYLIDSAVPVTVDFTHLDGITATDLDAAGIYVASDSVVLRNLANIRAGAAGVAISGTDVTVSNVGFADDSTSFSEIGVALLDGATDIALQDLSFASQWWASVMIDGSLDLAQQVAVTNIAIDGVTSRGVESGIGHIDIEDNAIVDGLSVTNSAFGVLGAEAFTSHALYFNTALAVDGLAFSGNTVEQGSGAEKNVLYFENSAASTFTDTVIDGNTFTGISRVLPLSRIIGDNVGTWSNLAYTGNTAEYTRGIRISGVVDGALFDGNVFTETREPSDAGITLGNALSNVTLSNNLLDTVWAVDGIRIEGASAENVVIEDNRIHDFYADGSRSAIAIMAPGTGNLVQRNEIVQDLSRADNVDLPANLFNHWAVYVWPAASAASAGDTVGWSILNNEIDGYQGTANAPIVHNAVGKLLVTGNTFGAQTRGSQAVETESGALWFLYNQQAGSNNRVQTFRPENVIYDGVDATFTAAQPAPELANTAAVAPVTLHVYWTADDNAEVYLGAISNVTPGQLVSIPATQTTGFLRVQTVDANGFTSQYSSVSPQAPVVAAPVVAGTAQTSAHGTATPAAGFTVFQGGNVVKTGTVAQDGTWSASGLACGTRYTVTQTVGGVESASAEFTTAACASGQGGQSGQGGSLETTGGSDSTGLMLGALALLAIGGGSLLLARRRRA